MSAVATFNGLELGAMICIGTDYKSYETFSYYKSITLSRKNYTWIHTMLRLYAHHSQGISQLDSRRSGMRFWRRLKITFLLQRVSPILYIWLSQYTSSCPNTHGIGTSA